MAVYRPSFNCPMCGLPYDVITNDNKDFIGDNFIRYDDHICYNENPKQPIKTEIKWNKNDTK